MKPSELHPSAEALLDFFLWSHLPSHLQDVSRPCGELAYRMINSCGSNAEFTAGLRKLLEAKDCFVRSTLQNKKEGENRK